MDDKIKFALTVKKLKEAGISGKASTHGYIIKYNDEVYNIDKDFKNVPKELKKFEKDLRYCFEGRVMGGISEKNYDEDGEYTPKQGVIRNDRIRDFAEYMRY